MADLDLNREDLVLLDSKRAPLSEDTALESVELGAPHWVVSGPTAEGASGVRLGLQALFSRMQEVYSRMIAEHCEEAAESEAREPEHERVHGLERESPADSSAPATVEPGVPC